MNIDDLFRKLYCTSLMLSILLPSPSVWWTESISESCSEILETWYRWVESVGSFNHTLLSAWRFSLLFFKTWTHSDHWTLLLSFGNQSRTSLLLSVSWNSILELSRGDWILKFLQKSRVDLRIKTCKRLLINLFLNGTT